MERLEKFLKDVKNLLLLVSPLIVRVLGKGTKFKVIGCGRIRGPKDAWEQHAFEKERLDGYDCSYFERNFLTL